jgi:hypothetical protein
MIPKKGEMKTNLEAGGFWSFNQRDKKGVATVDC